MPVAVLGAGELVQMTSYVLPSHFPHWINFERSGVAMVGSDLLRDPISDVARAKDTRRRYHEV